MAGLLTAGLLAFTAREYELRKNTAETDQAQGMYLFHQARPVGEYEVLGTVKVGGMVSSVKFETCRDVLLKKAKKEYPKADGLLVDGNAFQADAIKFK